MTRRADMDRALRYGLNLVYGDNPLNLIPWKSEPEAKQPEFFIHRFRRL